MKQLSRHIAYSIIAAIALSAFVFTSCSSEPKKDPNKTYTELTPDAITAIHASKAINVRFTQKDGAPQVNVICKNEYASDIDVHMEGSILVADYKPSAKQIADAGVEVNITAPAINEIDIDMAAIVNFSDEVKLNGDLRITCDHAGSLKAKKLKCNNLILNATNASVIQIAGIESNSVSAKATNSATMYLEGKCNSSTIQQVFDKQIRAEKLTTQNGHVERVNDAPLPELPKKNAPTTTPQKKDSTKVQSQPATLAKPATVTAAKQ